MCFHAKRRPVENEAAFHKPENYLELSSIATATATVIPTMGLLPNSICRPYLSFMLILRAYFSIFFVHFPDDLGLFVLIRP